MAKTNSSYEVPGAKEAMNKFKQEVANEVGVNLKQGYNGDLTSKQAGTIGGNMVKKMLSEPLQSIVESDEGLFGVDELIALGKTIKELSLYTILKENFNLCF